MARGTRRRCRGLVLGHAAFAAALLLAPASPARAIEDYNFTVGLLAGVGSALDADDNDTDNSSFQLDFGFVTDIRTHVVARLGRIDFGSDRLDSLTNADLTYLTVAGEYRFSEGYFESGLFLGLGVYELSGDRLDGSGDDSETSLGVTAGVTGEFEITRRLSFVLELAGHLVDLETSDAFATGHAGLAFHF